MIRLAHPTDAQLVKAIRSRRGTRAAAAENLLLVRHKPIVIVICNSYRTKREKKGLPIPASADPDDLVQVGWMAMLHVARDRPPLGWDPAKGTRFISFAKRRIVWAIQQELDRIPRTMNTGIDLSPVPALDPVEEPPDVSSLLVALTPLEAALITGVYGLDGIYKANESEAKNGKPGSVREVGARLGLNQVQAWKMIDQALDKMRKLGYGGTSQQDAVDHE